MDMQTKNEAIDFARSQFTSEGIFQATTEYAYSKLKVNDDLRAEIQSACELIAEDNGAKAPIEEGGVRAIIKLQTSPVPGKGDIHSIVGTMDAAYLRADKNCLNAIFESIIKRSETDPLFYEIAKRKSAGLLTHSEHIPVSVRDFAADVMIGSRKAPPKKRGPKNHKKNRIDPQTIGMAVNAVSARFNLPAYTNTEMIKITAAEIVAEALRIEGRATSISTVIKAYQLFKQRSESS